MKVTRNSDTIVSALIKHEMQVRGGFQPETNHKPLVLEMGKDSSFTITPIINDTEA